MRRLMLWILAPIVLVVGMFFWTLIVIGDRLSRFLNGGSR